MKKSMPGLIQELKEEFQNEAVLKAMRQYGPYLAGFVVFALLSIASYLIYENIQKRRAEEVSAQYENALNLIDADDFQAAQPVLEDIIKKTKGKGYGTLAQLAMISLAQKKALLSLDKAWASYWYEKSTEVASTLEGLYESAFSTYIKLATAYGCLHFDDFRAQGFALSEELKTLQTPQSPWFGMAGEIVFLQTLLNKIPDASGYMFSGKSLSKPWPFSKQLMENLFNPTYFSRFTSSGVRIRIEYVARALGLPCNFNMPSEATT